MGLAKYLLRPDFAAGFHLVPQLLPLHTSFWFLSGGREVPLTHMSSREVGTRQAPSLEVTPLRAATKERWRELCERVLVEQDPQRFEATVQELLRVLEDHEEHRRDALRSRTPHSETLPT
jgi:hypothetical protein